MIIIITTQIIIVVVSKIVKNDDDNNNDDNNTRDIKIPGCIWRGIAIYHSQVELFSIVWRWNFAVVNRK